MGGLWVDYNLMSTIPGLFVLGEANFSDHGANRLGASALMQGLADGYFVLPYTIGNYLASDEAREGRRPTIAEFEAAEADGRGAHDASCSAIKGKRTVDSFHRELGQDHVGQLRHGAQRGRASRTALAEDPGAARGVLAERARCPAAATSSTSRSRRPAAWPTSSSSAS